MFDQGKGCSWLWWHETWYVIAEHGHRTVLADWREGRTAQTQLTSPGPSPTLSPWILAVLIVWLLVLPAEGRATAPAPLRICPETVTAAGIFVQEIRGAIVNDIGGRAEYLICVPGDDFWNGDLLEYAHGTVLLNEGQEPGSLDSILNQLQLTDDIFLPRLFNELGYAFAVVSRSKPLLSVIQGMDEMKRLYSIFVAETLRQPRFTYLAGGSQGAQIAVLLLEGHPEIFDGGFAVCGPIGDFRRQVNYFLNFIVTFDYFFPEYGILSDGDIPKVSQVVLDTWDTLEADIETTLKDPTNADKVRQLAQIRLELLRPIATDPTEEVAVAETLLDTLGRAIFFVNDGVETLQGNPFQNRYKWYTGSDHPVFLNLGIRRYQADPAALGEINRAYQTSGQLSHPLVALHTVRDNRVPFWHELLYLKKASAAGTGSNVTSIPAFRYGHCNVEPVEALAAFALLVFKVSGLDLLGAETILPSRELQTQFRDLFEAFRSLNGTLNNQLIAPANQ